MNYTDKQIIFVKDKRASGLAWQEIADDYSRVFEDRKTANAMRKLHKRFENVDIEDSTIVKSLGTARRVSTQNKELKKAQTAILDQQLSLEDAMNAIKSLIESASFKQIKVPKIVHDKKKKNMIVECDFADAHFGKRGKKELIEKRIKKYTATILKEIDYKSKVYNIKEVLIPFLGDMIENSEFHGMESMESSDFQNSEQIRLAIETIFKDFLVPIFSTGYKCIVPCVTGNHSRYSKQRTYNSPGKNHLSWIIYNCLKMLAEAHGFKNVEFIIPEGVYCTYSVFGDVILFEHGDFIKGRTEDGYEAHIHKRSKQVGKAIRFMRMGHMHRSFSLDRGRIIMCGSLCGGDSYSEVNGYSSQPTQTITYYIEHSNYPDSFYYSFPIYLGE